MNGFDTTPPHETGQQSGSLLVMLRMLLSTFASSVVILGVVSFFIVRDVEDPALTTPVACAIAAALGLGGLLGATVVRRELPASDARSLAQAYQQRFFLRVALAEMPAIFGVALSLLSGTVAPYLVGAAFAAVGMWRAAPSDANLRAEDEAMALRGVPHSLQIVLRERTPSS